VIKIDINSFILNTTKKKKYIIHGAKSLSKQLPPELRRPTKDWDLWARNPQQAMDKLEDDLDKASGGDYYYEKTVPLIGSKKGEMVYRVISRITGEEVADFMKTPNEKNLYRVIGGIRWETLAHAKKVYQEILKNPQTRFDRKAKARGDLNRILAFERQLNKGSVKEVPGMFKVAPLRVAPFSFIKPSW